jgi:hypothetical protein
LPDSNIVVPLGAKNVNFNKMISLNNSGVFLWQQLQTEKTEAELLKAMRNEYDDIGLFILNIDKGRRVQLLNIGNFSKLTQVSVRMLRYYDEHGLLKPDHLRDMNFSVAEITEILKNWSDDFLIGQLQKKIQETEQSILSGQRLIEKIQTAIGDTRKKTD